MGLFRRRAIEELLKRSIVVYLAAAMVVLTAVPADVHAMFLPSSLPHTQDGSAMGRQKNLDQLQKLLESRVISQRLSDLGFSQEEVSSRLDRLSDEQIHYFATHLESVQAGGDAALGIIIALLIIAILVVLLLQLSGHKILITK